MPSLKNTLLNQRRLVLCFDGTGNKFQGQVSDTNIVKLFQMLDRQDPNQFHYYQPGIGTYSEGVQSNPQSYLAKLVTKISTAIDQGVATSFVDHVVAGYRFLMRYYEANDAIYIFGFSRGAYTARFLAEMVHTIGLLSRGNEEMIHFAWETFSEFQQCRGDDTKSDKVQEHEKFMVNFKQTFCRQGVKVHFLGLFDCVNSVSQFEVPLSQKSFTYIPRSSTTHVRHAVSIHERRLKFKPALFKMDNKDLSNDTVEMWFAGGHGDVGGGWDLEPNQRYLLSDTPLQWMLDEIYRLPETSSRLSFQSNSFRYSDSEAKKEPNLDREYHNSQGLKEETCTLHDVLAFEKSTSWFGAIFWWILELLPIFNRLELESGQWVPRHWPPNLGAPRDIPHGAQIHPSVYNLHRAGVLKDHQLPKTGGGNPHISPLSVSFAWNQTVNVDKDGNKTAAESENNLLESNGTSSFLPWKSKGKGRSVESVLSDGLSNGAARL